VARRTLSSRRSRPTCWGRVGPPAWSRGRLTCWPEGGAPVESVCSGGRHVYSPWAQRRWPGSGSRGAWGRRPPGTRAGGSVPSAGRSRALLRGGPASDARRWPSDPPGRSGGPALPAAPDRPGPSPHRSGRRPHRGGAHPTWPTERGDGQDTCSPSERPWGGPRRSARVRRPIRVGFVGPWRALGRSRRRAPGLDHQEPTGGASPAAGGSGCGGVVYRLRGALPATSSFGHRPALRIWSCLTSPASRRRGGPRPSACRQGTRARPAGTEPEPSRPSSEAAAGEHRRWLGPARP